MRKRLAQLWERRSLAQQYMLVSLLVLACGMAGIGWWVSREIQAAVAHETGAKTALFVNSVVAPVIQDMRDADQLSNRHVRTLDRLLHDTPLGQEIVSFKIWNAEGRILYSAHPNLIGAVFPPSPGFTAAWQGAVSSQFTSLEDDEHVGERGLGNRRLLETYIPILQENSNRIMAVAEFYHAVANLEGELASARARSWLIVGLATLAMYALLARIIRRGSDTIACQQRELQDKVQQLSGILAQNKRLGERVRRAVTGALAHNERFLRRISAELHDGPAQSLGLAALRLDSVIAESGGSECGDRALSDEDSDLHLVERALREALDEIRGISGGLVLPELEELTLAETIGRVVQVHRRRTQSHVDLEVEGVPEHADLPVKITLYRLIQEALANAYRHAGGAEQRVKVAGAADRLLVEVSDRGPGFDCAAVSEDGGKLGLTGMRERAESLGGTFRIKSTPGNGTIVMAQIPLEPVEGALGR